MDSRRLTTTSSPQRPGGTELSGDLAALLARSDEQLDAHFNAVFNNIPDPEARKRYRRDLLLQIRPDRDEGLRRIFDSVMRVYPDSQQPSHGRYGNQALFRLNSQVTQVESRPAIEGGAFQQVRPSVTPAIPGAQHIRLREPTGEDLNRLQEILAEPDEQTRNRQMTSWLRSTYDLTQDEATALTSRSAWTGTSGLASSVTNQIPGLLKKNTSISDSALQIRQNLASAAGPVRILVNNDRTTRGETEDYINVVNELIAHLRRDNKPIPATLTRELARLQGDTSELVNHRQTHAANRAGDTVQVAVGDALSFVPGLGSVAKSLIMIPVGAALNYGAQHVTAELERHRLADRLSVGAVGNNGLPNMAFATQKQLRAHYALIVIQGRIRELLERRSVLARQDDLDLAHFPRSTKIEAANKIKDLGKIEFEIKSLKSSAQEHRMNKVEYLLRHHFVDADRSQKDEIRRKFLQTLPNNGRLMELEKQRGEILIRLQELKEGKASGLATEAWNELMSIGHTIERHPRAAIDAIDAKLLDYAMQLQAFNNSPDGVAQNCELGRLLKSSNADLGAQAGAVLQHLPKSNTTQLTPKDINNLDPRNVGNIGDYLRGLPENVINAFPKNFSITLPDYEKRDEESLASSLVSAVAASAIPLYNTGARIADDVEAAMEYGRLTREGDELGQQIERIVAHNQLVAPQGFAPLTGGEEGNG